MRKRLLIGLVVGMLLAMMLPVVTSAKAEDSAICKDGGWRDLVRANGTPFDNQGGCVNYVAKGGIPRPPETILAIAYTNLDGVPGFDPAADRLIARFVDLDGNGPDAGDRVDMGGYPTAFSAPFGFAGFGVTSHQVTFADGGSTFVNSVSGVEPTATAHFFASNAGVDFYSEFNPNQDPQHDRVFIVDFHGQPPAENDRIEVRGSGGSAPTTPVEPALLRLDAQDDAFIDVDIFID